MENRRFVQVPSVSSQIHTRTIVDAEKRWHGVDLEVIIPALNEEDRIGATLMAVTAYLQKLPLNCLITVVDNGSADATADIVRRHDSIEVPVRLIGCRRRGKGAAVQAGIRASQAKWVGFCDADLATPISALQDVISHLAAGSPVVIGSRRCGGATYAHAQPRLRRAAGWMFRRVTRSLAGNLSDTQCGFKFFEGAVARDLFSEVTSAGFTFDLDLMAAAQRQGVPVVEVPVEWTDMSGSTLRPIEHGLEVMRELRVLRRMRANTDRVLEKV